MTHKAKIGHRDWPAGWFIGPPPESVSEQLVTAFSAMPVTIISDCLGRSVGAQGLRPYHCEGEVLCGTAVTVRVRPGDNLMLHKAMLTARAGDIIVVDGSGDVTQALVGGLMRTTAVSLGLGGFVIDGAVRDVAEWSAPGMPVFAVGNTHRGPSKEGPGEINVPISCGGLAVNPGDLVVGDADGVVCVRPDALTSLLAACEDKLAQEERTRLQNSSGAVDRERIEAILRAKGLPC